MITIEFNKQQSQMIPNVSAIYRDLSFMADPTPPSHHHQPQYSQQPHSFINDKQRRHNELMQKLRNAQRQSSNLQTEFSGNRQYQNTNPPQYNHSSSTKTYQQENSAYNNRSQQSSNEFQQRNQNSWKPPNIRYRHIQDFKQASSPPKISQQIQYKPNNNEQIYKNNEKVALQKQFYEENRQKSSDKKQPFSKQTKQQKKQDKNKIEDHISETSYGKTWVNRESKYEQKLQSYYQLCRKRPIPMKNQFEAESKVKKDKYLRTSNKVSGINLDKAMEMLLLE